MPITVADVEGWTVVDVGNEDLIPMAAGLTTPRSSWALVLASDGVLAGLTVFQRGRVSHQHVWNRPSILVGRGTAAASPWLGPLANSVDSGTLASLVVPQKLGEREAAIGDLLRRDGSPHVILDELVDQLGLGAAGRIAMGVLAGRPLVEHPLARRLEPPDSFWQFLRASASGAFLDPDEVPWFSILCAVLFFPLAGMLCFRSFQLVTGSLDGWGQAHLVAVVINTPFAYVHLRRVLRWRAMRRPR